MKTTIKMLGLFVLIGFSFFYTDKVLTVIREEDDIMIELTSVMDIYKVDSVDAKVIGNTIIPGLSGKVINIDKSYNKMKQVGMFNKNLIIYDNIKPVISIQNNKDKFIVSGNNNKQMVSIIFILNNDTNLDNINKILDNKGVIANYFVDYNYLVTNSTKIKEINHHEFYSYGDNGKYTPDNLLFSNNLISRIKDNLAIYCLSSNMKKDVLEICSKNNLYTITPSIIGGKNPYTMVKNNLKSGSIILLELNQETLRELSIIIDYIKGKGLSISPLSKLLSEELT